MKQRQVNSYQYKPKETCQKGKCHSTKSEKYLHPFKGFGIVMTSWSSLNVSSPLPLAKISSINFPTSYPSQFSTFLPLTPQKSGIQKQSLLIISSQVLLFCEITSPPSIQMNTKLLQKLQHLYIKQNIRKLWVTHLQTRAQVFPKSTIFFLKISCKTILLR